MSTPTVALPRTDADLTGFAAHVVTRYDEAFAVGAVSPELAAEFDALRERMREHAGHLAAMAGMPKGRWASATQSHTRRRTARVLHTAGIRLHLDLVEFAVRNAVTLRPRLHPTYSS